MSEWINPGRRIAWLLINIIPNHCPTTKVLCPRKSPEVNILPLVWHWCVASLGASRIYSIQIALGHSYVPAKQCQHKNEGSHWFFVFFQKYIGYTITPTWTIYMYMYMCMYMYMYEVYIYIAITFTVYTAKTAQFCRTFVNIPAPWSIYGIYVYAYIYIYIYIYGPVFCWLVATPKQIGN